MHSHLIHCATLLALALPLSAQQDPPQVPISSLIQQLRDPRSTAGERTKIVAELLTRGENGPRALYSFAKNDHATRHSQYQKSLAKHLQVFAAGARRMYEARLDPRLQQKVEKLQGEARALSRSKELSKQLIKDEIDPIVKRLTTYLVIPVRTILRAEKKVRASTRAIDAELIRLKESYRILLKAREAHGRDPAAKRQIERDGDPPSPNDFAAELKETRNWLGVLARPMKERDAKVLTRNHELRGQLGAEEYRGILELNLLRLKLGKAALAIDVKLCTAARDHSKDMQRLGFFSHTSPVPGKRSPSQRAAAAGTSGGAENIARGARTGAGAINQWWYSPGHHKNMMRGGGRVGLGQAGNFWTQMFG